MSTFKRMIFSVVVAGLLLPLVPCEAQKLKLPNLLPFRKKSQEIKPIQLSDGAAPRIQNKPVQDKGVFDFLKPQQGNTQKSAQNFGAKSKSFFEKTGDEIGQFANGTREFFSDAWNPPRSKKAWWNKSPKSFAGQPKKRFFKWPGGQEPNQIQPPPMPRTARQYQDGQPRHRFK